MTTHAMRQWKAADGRFQHHGSFLKENGIVIAVPFARLSKEDKQYVLKRHRSSCYERLPATITLDDDQPLGMYKAVYAQKMTSQEDMLEDLKVGKPHPKARSQLERKHVSKHPETSRPVARSKPQVASFPSARFYFLQMPQPANGDPLSTSLPVPPVPAPHRSSALPIPPGQVRDTVVPSAGLLATPSMIPNHQINNPMYGDLNSLLLQHTITHVDVESKRHLWNTCTSMRAFLAHHPACWHTLWFRPERHMNDGTIGSLLAWCLSKCINHHIQNLNLDGCQMTAMSVVAVLQTCTSLSVLSICHCMAMGTQTLASLLVEKAITGDMSCEALTAVYLNRCDCRGMPDPHVPLHVTSASMGQDVGLIGLSLCKMAAREIQFDAYLCRTCDVAACERGKECIGCQKNAVSNGTSL